MKTHLADVVYAEMKPGGRGKNSSLLQLTTKDGLGITNSILLDRKTWGALLNFVWLHWQEKR